MTAQRTIRIDDATWAEIQRCAAASGETATSWLLEAHRRRMRGGPLPELREVYALREQIAKVRAICEESAPKRGGR